MARRGRRNERRGTRNTVSDLKARNETERRNDDTATGSFPQVRKRGKGKMYPKVMYSHSISPLFCTFLIFSSII